MIDQTSSILPHSQAKEVIFLILCNTKDGFKTFSLPFLKLSQPHTI